MTCISNIYFRPSHTVTIVHSTDCDSSVQSVTGLNRQRHSGAWRENLKVAMPWMAYAPSGKAGVQG